MVKTSMACKETFFSLRKELSLVGDGASLYELNSLAIACLMSDDNASSSFPNIGPRSLLHRITLRFWSSPKTNSSGFWPVIFSKRKRNDFVLNLKPSSKPETLTRRKRFQSCIRLTLRDKAP